MKFDTVGAGLEQLEEKVGRADVLEKRSRRPLSAQIEDTELAVGRLEGTRSWARQVQDGGRKEGAGGLI